MNDDFIVTAYVVLDETMRALEHRSQPLARVCDAEVLTVAVVAAKYFANQHERALLVMRLGHYLSGPMSTSRLNRRCRPWPSCSRRARPVSARACRSPSAAARCAGRRTAALARPSARSASAGGCT